MPTTPLGVWTPDDSDDWDLTVDLAAMAVSIDSAIDNGINAIPKNYMIGTNAERLALSGGALFTGLKFYTTDTKVEWIYSNSAWRLASPQGGTVTGADVPANAYTGSWATITFPVAYSTPPLVQLTPVESGAVQRLVASVQSRTATQCVVTIRNVSGAAATSPVVQWTAIAA